MLTRTFHCYHININCLRIVISPFLFQAVKVWPIFFLDSNPPIITMLVQIAEVELALGQRSRSRLLGFKLLQNTTGDNFCVVCFCSKLLKYGFFSSETATPSIIIYHTPHNEVCVCVWGGGGIGIARSIFPSCDWMVSSEHLNLL